MFCNNCGNPLPNKGAVCTFCGAMMDKKQIETNREYNKENNKNNNIELKSEKYGYDNNFEFRTEKSENKILGIVIISIVVLFLIILAILLNV